MTRTFSVVIPLYNSGSYVRRCLSSVEAQTLRPHEVIVVDDGSTDGSAELVAEEFPQIVLIRQENQGVAAARNRGIAQASSDWIAFLDSDDYWFANHLQELAQIRSDFGDAKLVSTAFCRWIEGQETPLAKPRTRSRRIDYFREAAFDIGIVCSSSAAAAKEQLDKVGAFPAFGSGEDLACWAALALDEPVAVSDAVTAVYVQHPTSAMALQTAQPLPNRVAPEATYDQVGPSTAVAAGALATGPHLASSSDISLYVDSRINSAIRHALLTDDRSRVDALQRLRTQPFRSEYWTLHVAERLPNWLLQQYRRARRRANHLER